MVVENSTSAVGDRDEMQCATAVGAVSSALGSSPKSKLRCECVGRSETTNGSSLFWFITNDERKDVRPFPSSLDVTKRYYDLC